MANDITILSCPQCGFPQIRDCGNGLYQCDDCGTHFDKSENIVLTEQEWLQTATTEQLAEWIVNITDYCYMCGSNPQNYRNFPFGKCVDKEHVVEWLKQPHTKEQQNGIYSVALSVICLVVIKHYYWDINEQVTSK